MSTRILIAEDEFCVRSEIAEFLHEAGYEIVEAANADEALCILRTGDPVDLLFSDIRMPGSMDGCGLAEIVHETWPNTHIILTSGFSRELMDSRKMEKYVVLPKPYRALAVLSAIEAAVGRCANAPEPYRPG